MTETTKLTKGQKVNYVPEGYTIECNAVFDNIDTAISIELGVFNVEDLDTLALVIQTLVESIGPANRMKVNHFINEFSSWPMDTVTGIPAYLEGMTVIFNDGAGDQYLMQPERGTCYEQ